MIKFLLKIFYNFNNQYRFTISDSSYIFNNCYFTRNHILVGFGGIIYSIGVESKIELIECIFYSCSSTLNSGAIYFLSFEENCYIKLNKICVNNCFSKWNQFSNFETNKNSNNTFNLISINSCNNIKNGFSVLFIGNGKNILKNLNSSNNFNSMASGFWIENNIIFNILFYNLINNIVSSDILLYLDSNFQNNFTYFNIINNNSPLNGILYIDQGLFNFENCNFLNNKNILFFIEEKSNLIICNCQIFHQDLLYLGNINLFNNNIIKKIKNLNTFLIIHYSTIYCLNNYLEFTKIKKIFINFNFLIIILISLISYNKIISIINFYKIYWS